MSYTWPSSDLDRPVKVLTLQGSVWTNLYVGSDFQVTRTRGKLEIAQQNFDDLTAATNTISRLLIPLWHIENWYALQLVESEMSDEAAIWHFDDEGLPNFDASPGFTFDQALTTGSVGTPIPDDLATVAMIADRMTDAQVILIRDVDFLLVESENAIVFHENPFDNPAILTEKVFEGGEIVDRTMILWLLQSRFDWQLLYNHFGYVLKLNLSNAQDYKDIINIIMDCMVRATSQVDIERLIATAYGIPLVQQYSELVEDVREDRNELLVITDQDVYGHTRASEALVSAGDEVSLGQSLTDAMTVYELRRGVTIPELPALTVPIGMLDPAVGGELVWINRLVPVTVTGAVGQEWLEWPLGGTSEAVAAFWDLTYQRRLLYGASLYDLFIEQYGSVPAEINPMEFLIENVLRNSVFVVVIHRSGISEDALNAAIDVGLRKTMPPHCMVLVVIEMAELTDSVTLGESTNAGMGLGVGMETLTGSVGGTQSRINLW